MCAALLATDAAPAQVQTASTQLHDAGQATASAPAEVWELPADARAALAHIQDGAFNFDQPGFYAVLEFVKRSPQSPGFAQTPIVIADWRDLAERPADFRGRPVTIRGRVGRNKAPYGLHSRPELGLLSQLELRPAGDAGWPAEGSHVAGAQPPGGDNSSDANLPLSATLILTEPAADIPLDAVITVTGYFVMLRSYHGPPQRYGGASQRVHQAVLLVAPGPTVIERTASGSARTDDRAGGAFGGP
ncbi:MAG: hypothetical protein AB1716_02220, partial [Planctomycetota bacterium]